MWCKQQARESQSRAASPTKMHVHTKRMENGRTVNTSSNNVYYLKEPKPQVDLSKVTKATMLTPPLFTWANNLSLHESICPWRIFLTLQVLLERIIFQRALHQQLVTSNVNHNLLLYWIFYALQLHRLFLRLIILFSKCIQAVSKTDVYIWKGTSASIWSIIRFDNAL